jgi:acetamidase/formamidase
MSTLILIGFNTGFSLSLFHIRDLQTEKLFSRTRDGISKLSAREMQVIDGTDLKNIHFKWTNSNRPIASIENGEIVSALIPDSSTMQVKEDWSKTDIAKMDTSLVDGAVGPIYINGAKKGDVLRIDILDIKVGSWGWTMTEKSAPLLRDRFEDNLTIWKLKDGLAESKSDFLKGTRVPLSPFLGVMGVAPESGKYGMMPPQYFGGNIDNKLLTAGSSLYLPVSVDGALFSIADPHAAQGDGEAGCTGLETSATVILRIGVEKGKKPIRYPRAIAKTGSRDLLVTMGIAPDLYGASKIAMEEMVDELSSHGYSDAEGYVLCSLMGDFRISELVDEPNFVVTMTFPTDVLNRAPNSP